MMGTERAPQWRMTRISEDSVHIAWTHFALLMTREQANDFAKSLLRVANAEADGRTELDVELEAILAEADGTGGAAS